MATLSGNKIKDTYQSLVKFSDNGNITVGAKQLTDGFGNNSPMFVSTTQVGIGVTPEAGLNLHVFGDAKIGSNLTVIGNLVVEGSTTTVGTDTLTVKDPLIVLANNNTSTDAVDIGFYGKYTPSGTTLYSGLFREALTGKYRLFKGLEVEPTTTVNTSGTGYTKADLVIGNLETTQVDLRDDEKIRLGDNQELEIYHFNNDYSWIKHSGTQALFIQSDELNIRSNQGTENMITASYNGSVDLWYDGSKKLETTSTGVNIDGQLVIDDELTIEGSAFGRIEIGGASGGYVDLKAPNSDDYDLRLITSVGGAELLSIDTLKFYTGATTDLAFTIDASQNATFENNVTIPETPTADTHAASKGYVDAAVEGQDTLAEILANGNTSGANDIIMADNQKIYYGTGSDVEMYFDGATQFGIINDTAGGSIFLRSDSFLFRNDTDQFYSLSSTTHTFKSSGTTRLTVNSTGIYVTGTGVFTQDLWINTGQKLFFDNGGDCYISEDTTGRLKFVVDGSEFMRLGDGIPDTITFYKDSTFAGDLTVDTDTLFVDASEDSVGIGLTNPSDYSADELVISVPDDSGMTFISGITDTAYIRFADGTAAADQANFISHDHDTNTLTVFSQAKVSIGILEAEVAYFTDTNFYVDKSTTIDDTLIVNGNVGIGTDSPDELLHLKKSSGNAGLEIEAVSAGDPIINFVSANNRTGDLFYTDATTLARFSYDHSDVAFKMYAHNQASVDFYLSETTAYFPTQNVGIGTTSPSSTLDVRGSGEWYDAGIIVRRDAAPTQFGTISQYNGSLNLISVVGGGGSNGEIMFSNHNAATGTPTERMRIDGSGIVKIFTTGGTSEKTYSASAGLQLYSQQSDAGSPYTKTSDIVANGDGTVPSELRMFTKASGSSTPTERMRITSGGAVLINNTSGAGGTPPNSGFVLETGGNIKFRVSSNGSAASQYYNATGTIVGSVVVNASTTAYNTSSDYRLKENVVEMTGALDRVSQLKPSRFNFIADANKTVDGFLAHEVQEIVPEAISGEKDAMRTEEYEVSPAVYEDVVHPAEEAVYETVEHPAVEEELDDEGNVVVEAVEAYTEEVLVTEAKEEWTEKVLVTEKVMGTREVPDYQGIDQSKLVPLLVGAIQEQQQLINDLKNRIETLENN